MKKPKVRKVPIRRHKPQVKGQTNYNSHLTKNDVVKKIVGGWERKEILAYLEEKGMKYDRAASLYESSLSLIHSRAERDLDNNLKVHIYIYEKLYRFFNDAKYTKGKLRALDQKEKLLGLHKNDTEIEINNTVNLSISGSIYDRNKLSPKENTRMDELMSKIGKKDLKTLEQQVEQRHLR